MKGVAARRGDSRAALLGGRRRPASEDEKEGGKPKMRLHGFSGSFLWDHKGRLRHSKVVACPVHVLVGVVCPGISADRDAPITSPASHGSLPLRASDSFPKTTRNELLGADNGFTLGAPFQKVQDREEHLPQSGHPPLSSPPPLG